MRRYAFYPIMSNKLRIYEVKFRDRGIKVVKVIKNSTGLEENTIDGCGLFLDLFSDIFHHFGGVLAAEDIFVTVFKFNKEAVRCFAVVSKIFA